jgi:hypothetical protein
VTSRPYSPEVQFEVLAEETSSQAAAIECTPGEYREGLTTIIERLMTDRQASRETSPEEDE